jgi:hypothetical protein
VRFDDPQRVARIVAATRAREPAIVAELEKSRAPGAAMGVVVDGQLVYFKAVGVRELSSAGAPRLVDEDTVFRIASMSKAFVTAAIVRLRDDGKLALDDAAEKYLPELRALRYPTTDSPRVTIRQLISQSAGFPEDNASGDLRMSMSDADFDALLATERAFSSTCPSRKRSSATCTAAARSARTSRACASAATSPRDHTHCPTGAANACAGAENTSQNSAMSRIPNPGRHGPGGSTKLMLYRALLWRSVPFTAR